jgi:hypothetical protein
MLIVALSNKTQAQVEMLSAWVLLLIRTYD